MTEPTIIRSLHDKDHPFVVTASAPAQNREMSFEARGALWYLLSKPDGWKVKERDLEQCCGRDKTRRIMNELVIFGHLEKLKQERRPDGTLLEVEYRVRETPLTENPTQGEQPDTENPSVDSVPDNEPLTGLPLTAQPLTVNPTLYNKDLLTIQEDITDCADAAGETPPAPPGSSNPQLHKHPAVQAFRELTHRYPAQAWYQKIIDVVGDNTEKWRTIVTDWVGYGWNPTNVKGMLDVFTNGWERNGNGSKPSSTPGTIPKGMEKQNRSDIKKLTPEQEAAVDRAIRASRQKEYGHG